MSDDRSMSGLEPRTTDWGEACRSMPVRLALAWIAGVLVGTAAGWLYVWLGLVVLLLGGAVWCRGHAVRRGRDGGRWVEGLTVAGVVCIAAGWTSVSNHYTSRHSIERVMPGDKTGGPALARVRGEVASVPRDVLPEQGAFGQFNFRDPGTLFELKLDAVDRGRGFEGVNGAVLVRIKEHDHRPKLGQRIEAVGWLSEIRSTQNPGEFDYKAYLQREGITGRITLARKDNWQPLSEPPRFTLTGIRRSIGDAAAASLALGMPHDTERQGLLEALLLGRRTGDIKDLTESFRAVGLAHILSISGAHLGILLALVWWIGRLVIGRPSLVAVLVLVVLALFLLAVPWRTPIVRASIMAGVFCCGYGLGRKLTGIDLLAASALIVLVWKPTDLFDAGFQLSFGVVGALLVFARPVSLRLLPEPEVAVVHPTGWDLAMRGLADFAAVSIVAFVAAMPVVMYHFQLISPLAAVLSMLALLPLTGLLALGYLKILVGLILPSVGTGLAAPLAWLTDSLVALVERTGGWSVASVELSRPVSVAWTLGAVAAVCALLGGAFARRRIALMLVLVLVGGWAWVEQHPAVLGRSVERGLIQPDRHGLAGDQAALTVNMFAVGDGSCYLLRCDGQTLMFDCGSQAFLRIGERSVVPGLMALGVTRIDILMLSHADLDHYVGVLDVVDAVAVGRVLVSPDVLREAEQKPAAATAHLIAGLRLRAIEPIPIERGWVGDLGRVGLEVLWPAAGFVGEVNNDNSLVLRATLGQHRVLLNGDIQQQAMTELLGQGTDLRADITDLAHHGSFVSASPDWFAAVGPRVVLQSSGWRRPDQDSWRDRLATAGVPRLMSDELGMVELRLDADGRITWASHRGPGGVVPGRSD
ncbi:MAG: ComEC/Rec2 family competence protein [Planctomycetota bacterium]